MNKNLQIDWFFYVVAVAVFVFLFFAVLIILVSEGVKVFLR